MIPRVQTDIDRFIAACCSRSSGEFSTAAGVRTAFHLWDRHWGSGRPVRSRHINARLLEAGFERGTVGETTVWLDLALDMASIHSAA